MASTTASDSNGVQNLSDKLTATSIPPKEAEVVGEGEEDEDDGEAEDAAATGTGTSNKKKKKKKSGAAKRKAKGSKQPIQQTDPPTIGLTKIFLDGCYPVGEIQEYDTSKFLDETRKHVSKEELRERERILQETEGNDYNLIRKAAEVHRQVRQYAKRTIKPGMSMIQIADLIEDTLRALVEANGLEAGIAFPTGLSLNEVAAHYHPNSTDKRILQAGDVLKVDIGVQVSGRICDSAFTIAFDEDWNPLLEAVKAATNEGVKQAGIDARMQDIGEAIQEVMESHEFDVKGKTYKVKTIENLNGHSIGRYHIHHGQSIPATGRATDERMHENEYYAVETFGVAGGKGYVLNSGECSHYALMKEDPSVVKTLQLASARKVLHSIKTNFGTLPFSRRYLERAGETNYLLGLKSLVAQGIVRDYPPLADLPGSMTAQFEHTILLRPTCKEVVSRGDDY